MIYKFIYLLIYFIKPKHEFFYFLINKSHNIRKSNDNIEVFFYVLKINLEFYRQGSADKITSRY